MEKSWNILQMKRITSNGLVVDVSYSFNAEENNVLDRKVGKLTFSGSPSEPNYIPYENLTEQIVLGWVFDKLGPQKAIIETEVTERVIAEIQKRNTDPYSTGKPWENTNNL